MSNLLLMTDSYKASHYLQYPKETEIVSSYIEARGFDNDTLFTGDHIFFGLQGILKKYLCGKAFDSDDIEEAGKLITAHGEPFNHDGWTSMYKKWGGVLPIRVWAVDEGTWHKPGTPLVVVENTDPEFYWLTSYLEPLFMRLWYPTTVATLSGQVKHVLNGFHESTSDSPADSVLFKLHDFGARGVSSAESAGIGGCSHLVNFRGSDTLEALVYARDYYSEKLAGFSIPAAEHSTITTWGRHGEADAYRNMLRNFAKPGSVLAVVSDSYDIYNACEHIWGETLKQEVVDSGATVIIRPDSGDPVTVVSRCLQILDSKFGTTTNSKGFKVLNNVRLIQGDGVNPFSIRDICDAIVANGYALDNIAFGMGGALLQKVNRDTLKFAMKCSAMEIGGVWRDVYKEPVTDSGKTSKRGRQVTKDMRLMFEHGKLLRETTLSKVRMNSNG